MTVQLAMYKGKGHLSNSLIRWKTNSKYSHCELVIDGFCYSSSFMDGGVRGKSIVLNSEDWDIINLPWADKESVLRYFDNTNGTAYGTIGLFTSQILNMSTDTYGDFCSEWCGKALSFPNSKQLSPAGLLDVCLFLNNMYRKANNASGRLA